MTLEELCSWLLQVGIRDEYLLLSIILAASELSSIDVSPELKERVSSLDWKRLLFAASILARSEHKDAESVALKIATGCVTLSASKQIAEAGALIFDKLSNNVSLQLAEQRDYIEDKLLPRLGVTARIEAARRSLENSVLLHHTGEFITANKFQREFWDYACGTTQWLSISSPTASGKTYIVIQWLLDQVFSGRSSLIIYLAPTRALVSEIEDTFVHKCENLRRTDVLITSLPLPGVIDQGQAEGKKLIIVATQERLQVFLNIIPKTSKVDLLVVDEAHKIADKMRGLILQDSVERLVRSYSKCRVVFISPSTQNPDILLEDAPNDASRSAVRSHFSTVVQNLYLVTQVPRRPKQWLFSARIDGEAEPIGIITLDNSPSNIKKKLAFLSFAASPNGGTLVYANSASEAEDIADLIAQLAPQPRPESRAEIRKLIDLAGKGVHRRYGLIATLKKGVAFHYGNMPSLLRAEIERLFKEGHLSFIVCTSTLVEGVNLACKTIVVRGPRKGPGNPMNAQDFWNLAGRAGRWGNEFSGNIICIDPNDKTAWPEGVPEKKSFDIRREVDTVLGDRQNVVSYFNNRLSVPVASLRGKDRSEQLLAYLTASKLRSGSLIDTKLSMRFDAAYLSQLDQLTDRINANVSFSSEILARHVGVSAYAMNGLLEYFKAYPGPASDLLPSPPDSSDAAEVLQNIMYKINNNMFPVFIPDAVVPLHALITTFWMKGLPLSAIIRERTQYYERNKRTYKLPHLIRETMQLVEQVARFLAPKYVSAYVSVLKIYLAESGQSELMTEELDISISMEFGISSVTMISLTELGLSRMSAVALYEKMAVDDLSQAGCLQWLQEYSGRLFDIGIPALVIAEIRRKIPTLSFAEPQMSDSEFSPDEDDVT